MFESCLGREWGINTIEFWVLGGLKWGLSSRTVSSLECSMARTWDVISGFMVDITIVNRGYNGL